MNQDWRNDPPSEKQLKRLKWWAQRMGVPIPRPKTKGDASDLIEDWQDERQDILELWEAEKEKIDREREFEDQLLRWEDDVDDWRGFHKCRKVSHSAYIQTAREIGGRRQGEKMDAFMVRFFGQLKQTHPSLFTAEQRHVRRKQSSCLYALTCLSVLFVCVLWLCGHLIKSAHALHSTP